MLTPFADDVWVEAREAKFLGLETGTRMTVVRLAGGGLFVHSPVALDDATRRAEERGGYGGADCERLGRIGQRLAVGLTGLLDAGTAITPGRLPVLVPVFRSGPSAEPDEEPPWGAPGVAGSAGLSLMYPLQRLADVLNRATAMDHVTAAAELCVMAPFRAGAMVLAAVFDVGLPLGG